jgi:hypothetical protein
MGSVPHVELLERRSATASLQEALADATRGAGRIVFVSGEAGIGKTSLVRAFVEDVPRGTRVLSGACDDLLTPAPLGAIRDVARRTHGPLATALAGSGEVAAAVLAELSAGPPTVLLVEDLHWADEATLDLLAFVARRIGDLRAVVVLTYRDDEVGRAAPLRRLLGAARRRCASRWTAVAQRGDRALPRPGRRAARPRPHAGQPVPRHRAAPRGRTAARERQRVRARTAHPAAEVSRAFVEQIAVIPARAEPALLDVLQPGWADLTAPAEELGVLDVRDGVLTFRHELARQAVEESLPGGRRIQLNRAVLAALLADEPPDRARILHHADRCRDVDAVLAHGPAAARAAAAAGAHQQALAYREQVLPVAAHLPDRATFFDELAWEYYYANRFADAVTAARTAVDLREDSKTLVTLARQLYMNADLREARAVIDGRSPSRRPTRSPPPTARCCSCSPTTSRRHCPRSRRRPSSQRAGTTSSRSAPATRAWPACSSAT